MSSSPFVQFASAVFSARTHLCHHLFPSALLLLLLALPARAADRVTITYWRPTYDVERDATVRMIRDFEAKYPHIRINMVPTSSYEEKIKTALAGGVGPDIMAVDGPLIAFYAYQGALIPLDRYYTPEGKADLIPASLEEITWNGHLWTGPLNNSSIAVYYNEAMFERAGIVPPRMADRAWTWEQFVAQIKRVMEANRAGAWQPWGLMFGIGINEFAAYAEMPWLWQTGGQVMRPDGLRATGYLDSPASVRGLTTFQHLFRVDRVAPVEEITEGFVTGKAATVISGPWSIPFYKDVYPNFKYGIMPLPRDMKQVTPCGSWHMAVTSQSRHPDEAWRFIDWMTGIEGAKQWYRETRNLPARQSTYDAFPDLSAYPMRIFADQVRFTARPRPVTPVYPIVTDAVAQAFQSAAYGQPPAEVLTKAARRIDEETAYEQAAEAGRQMPRWLIVIAGLLAVLSAGVAGVRLRRYLRARTTRYRVHDVLWGYGLVAPAVCGIAVFVVIPMLFALYLSFHHPYVLRPQARMAFVGWANYQQLFGDPLFWKSLLNSAYFTVVVVPIQTTVALGLALLVREKIKGVAVFRSAFFVPVVTAMVVVAIIWRLLYNVNAGVFNGLLVRFGVPKQLFLASATQAMPSVIAMCIWKSCGFFMLIFLAGLQAIPEELYDAAKVDGAGRWHRFRHITLPLLNPAMLFTLVITSMDAMKLFGPIFIITNGGPLHATTVIVYYIYKAMFLFLKVGYAAAMAFVLFGIILTLTLVQMRVLRREAVY
ncbi:MAG: extracellular solute-binding protein [Candidatus Latescibacteria bacterium]|nr:extracellular solute-binding protein [Candidatus Latescibacterota bacterium]